MLVSREERRSEVIDLAFSIVDYRFHFDKKGTPPNIEILKNRVEFSRKVWILTSF